MSSLPIVQPARKPGEILEELIEEANRRTANNEFDDATDVARPEMTREEWDEMDFHDCVSRIESLGSHYIQRAQERWAAMAKAAEARAAALANCSPEDDNDIAF